MPGSQKARAQPPLRTQPAVSPPQQPRPEAASPGEPCTPRKLSPQASWEQIPGLSIGPRAQSRSETHTPDNFWKKKRNKGKTLIILGLDDSGRAHQNHEANLCAGLSTVLAFTRLLAVMSRAVDPQSFRGTLRVNRYGEGKQRGLPCAPGGA